MELNQALVTGTFGVFVAIITWFLAGLREMGVNKREAKKQKQEKLECLYADTISTLEMVLRAVNSQKGLEKLESQLSKNNGMLFLLANAEVNKMAVSTSDLIEEWSALFAKGSPSRISDDVSLSTCQDSKYMERANRLFPKVKESISLLIDTMKKHITELENA